mmetsp:Transcript_99023/g.317610  ORF Transcript_99023/g.317610 Transcript_99023/m.317610 type:complete len:553 (+) Transcript_99023:177-1835(+)
MAPKSAKAKAKAPAAKEKAEEEGAGNGKRAPSAGSSERPAAKKRAKAKPKPTAEEAAEESAVQGSVPKPRAATRGPQGGKRKQPAVPSPPPPGGGLHRFFSALPKAGAAVSGSSADPPPDPSLDPPASGEVAAPAAGPGGSDEGAESAPAELEGDPVVGPAASPPPSPCAALSQHGGAAAASTHEPVPAAGTADTEPRAEGAEADTETRVAGPEAATSQEAPASSPRRPLRAAAAGASAPSSQEALMSSPRPSRAREAPEPEPDDVQVLDFGSLRRADWLQYNSMYTARLAQLRSSVVQHAQSLWSGAVSPAAFKPSLVGYRGSARERGAVLVGVICKEMKLRPSTVEQYRSGLRALDFLDAAAAAAERGAAPGALCSEGDVLWLEDDTMRIELMCAPHLVALLATGLVAAVLGQATPEGRFRVRDLCFAQVPAPIERPRTLPRRHYVAFVSGLGLGATSAAGGEDVAARLEEARGRLVDFVLGAALGGGAGTGGGLGPGWRRRLGLRRKLPGGAGCRGEDPWLDRRHPEGDEQARHSSIAEWLPQQGLRQV